MKKRFLTVAIALIGLIAGRMATAQPGDNYDVDFIDYKCLGE